MILGSEESLSRKPLLQNHIDLSSGSMSQEYLEEYKKIGLEINRYANIDDFVCDYLQS